MKFTKLNMDSDTQLMSMEFETYPELNPPFVLDLVKSAIGDHNCFKGGVHIDPNRYVIYIDCNLYEPESEPTGHLLVFTKMMLTADELGSYLFEDFARGMI